MSRCEVTEFCLSCMSEITMQWDTEMYGYMAHCPVCGARLMLCNKCCEDGSADDCDYNSETDSCKFNRKNTVTDGEYVATQVSNGHIWITKNNQMVMRIEASKRMSKEELLDKIDLYRKLTGINQKNEWRTEHGMVN